MEEEASFTSHSTVMDLSMPPSVPSMADILMEHSALPDQRLSGNHRVMTTLSPMEVVPVVQQSKLNRTVDITSTLSPMESVPVVQQSKLNRAVEMTPTLSPMEVVPVVQQPKLNRTVEMASDSIVDSVVAVQPSLVETFDEPKLLQLPLSTPSLVTLVPNVTSKSTSVTATDDIDKQKQLPVSPSLITPVSSPPQIVKETTNIQSIVKAEEWPVIPIQTKCLICKKPVKNDGVNMFHSVTCQTGVSYATKLSEVIETNLDSPAVVESEQICTLCACWLDEVDGLEVRLNVLKSEIKTRYLLKEYTALNNADIKLEQLFQYRVNTENRHCDGSDRVNTDNYQFVESDTKLDCENQNDDDDSDEEWFNKIKKEKRRSKRITRKRLVKKKRSKNIERSSKRRKKVKNRETAEAKEKVEEVLIKVEVDEAQIGNTEDRTNEEEVEQTVNDNLLQIEKTPEGYKCPICFKCLPSKRGLVLHHSNHCKPSRKGRPHQQLAWKNRVHLVSDGLYECRWCNERSKNRDQLVVHAQTHIPADMTCPSCSKSFQTLYALQYHLDGCLKQVIHNCEICGKILASEWNLKSHMEIHKEERKKENMCQICGAKYYTRAQVKKHILGAHCAEKPFQCTICPQRFTRNDTMRRHINDVHYQMCSFSCHVCGDRFKRKNILLDHIKSKHKESL